MVPAMYTANSARLIGTPHGIGIASWLQTAVRAANRAQPTILCRRALEAVVFMITFLTLLGVSKKSKI